MEFKPSEIALLVLAIVGPLVFFILAIIPGGLGFVVDIVMDPVRGTPVFLAAAGVLAIVLAWRLYRRIRPVERKPITTTEHVSPAKMPKVEGSKAVEQLKNRKPG